MTLENEKLEKLRAAAPADEVSSRRNTCAAVLFLSLDLVNSTIFKGREKIWPLVVSKFYEVCIRDLQNRVEGVRVWKHAGDEVLFYMPVRRPRDVSSAVQQLHAVVSLSAQHLHNTFRVTEGILDVKGAAWIANIWRIEPGDIAETIQWLNTADVLESNNIISSAFENVPSDVVEFIGRDIDLGFRLTRFSHKQKVVVSPDVARIILEDARSSNFDAGNSLRIVAYKPLKGVWNERPVPIIWYHDNWPEVDVTFDYDETSSELFEWAEAGKRAASPLTELERVYRDLGLQRHYDRLMESIKYPTLVHIDAESQELELERLAEVHVVAVCVDINGRVLIAKRPESKRIEPGKWEFGCAQLRRNTDFVDSVREHYMGDFGIRILDISEKPLSVYFIPTKKVPGIVFAARIGKRSPEPKYNRQRHTEARWISAEQADGMGDGEFVPAGKERIRAAIRYWREHWTQA